MCLAMVLDAKTVVHDSWLEDFHEYNQDGFGFIFHAPKGAFDLNGVFPKKPRVRKVTAAPGQFRLSHGPSVSGIELVEGYQVTRQRSGYTVVRGVGTTAEFVETWRRVMAAAARSAKTTKVVVHLRMRTHGLVDLENTHPYEIAPGLWMVHNGVLVQGNGDDVSRSDTWHYVKNVLAPLYRLGGVELLKAGIIQRLVEADIGGGNKFVLFGEGITQPIVLNVHKGITFCNVWMSNTYAWTSASRNLGTLDKPLVEPPPPFKWQGTGSLSLGDTWSAPVRPVVEDNVPRATDLGVDAWKTMRELREEFRDAGRIAEWHKLLWRQKAALAEGGDDALYEIADALQSLASEADIELIADSWADVLYSGGDEDDGADDVSEGFDTSAVPLSHAV